MTGIFQPPSDVLDFLRAHPPPADMPPCPLPEGIYLWCWPGGHSEGWKTVQFQADRARRLGARGIIAQASLFAPVWLEGRDPGDARPRIEVFHDAGLLGIAGFGLDGGHALQEVIGALVHAVMVADGGMLDHEAVSLWEKLSGRGYARAIVEGVLNELAKRTGLAPDVMRRVAAALAGSFFVDADWWEPLVHMNAPTLIFWLLALYKFVQAYGAPTKENPEETEWMLEKSQTDYPKIGVPASVICPSEQMYGHTLNAATQLVFCEHPVKCFWDVEEMDRVFEAVLLARVALSNRYNVVNPTRAHIVRLEQEEGLAVDSGDLGPETFRALNIPFPAAA